MQGDVIICLFSLMSLASLNIATQAVCLECWEALCNPDVPIPQKCSCDCVIDPVNGETCEEVAKLDFSDGSCCLEANEYLDQEIYPSLTPVSSSGGQCSLVYNRSVNHNISRSAYSLLPLDRVFVIDAVEFNCVGCIQSISLYLDQSTNVDDNTKFTLSVWRPHTSAPDNSTVFVSINSSQVNFDSQPVMWNNIYRADSTVHDALCFEPGDRVGLTIRQSFAGKILRPSTSNGMMYMQHYSDCESLNDVLLEDSAQTYESEVPLMDVTVIPSGLVASSAPPSISNHTITIYSSTVTIAAPLFPTITSSNDVIMSTGSSLPSPSSLTYIIVGIVCVVLVPLVALVCGVIVTWVFIVKKQKIGQVDITDRMSTEMRAGQPQVQPGESNGSFIFAQGDWQHHSPALAHENMLNAFNNNEWNGQDEQPHHYDDPSALNTVPPRSSQFSLNDHYMCMDTPDSGDTSNTTSPSQTLLSPGYHHPHPSNRPPSRNDHYQSPRTPASSSLSSDYDSTTPAVLDRFTSRQTSSATTAPHPLNHVYHMLDGPVEIAQGNAKHSYHVLENNSKEEFPPVPPRSSSITKHDYHILQQPTKEHHYHVMEKGFHVPGADDRLSWAHGSMQVSGANFLSQQLILKHQGIGFFDESDHYWEPADKPDTIYDQLKSNKCREIPVNCLEFDDEIGSGHFGVVHKGTWKLSGGGQKTVAIKTLKPQTSEEQKMRLLQEGARMMQFFHSNVVTLHGMVTMGDMPMLIIEYMTNGDLVSFLQQAKRNKDIPQPQLMLRFCRDIAAGMRHLAKKKFVHRDLAARNILLNESLVCKISDFGMTRDNIYSYDMNAAEHIPLRWTPLEALNERKYSEKSDVYSYGMVLFEIWSLGQKPLTMMSDRDVIINFIEQGGVCFPPPGCPRQIYRLMIQCWHPTPIRRPSFGDILEDYLSASDEALLHWSTQDKRSSPKAFEIGASIQEGFSLYVDLQKTYREQ